MAWPEGESVGALRYLERVVVSSAPGNHNMLILNPVCSVLEDGKEGLGGGWWVILTFED